MADEKTYKANLDVDTKDAAKNMDLLTKTVDTSLGSFENLNEAIGKTQDTLGKIDPKSAEFKELSKELAGLKDRLRETESQSLRFTEALAQQPGVIGLVGQSVEGLRGTLKIFMANPIIAVLTAIAGAFLLLKESLSKTSEGQETLNRISAAFGKIIGPVMAIIEKVALPIFEKFADLLSLVAEGFSKFAKFLGVSETKIEEASRNSSDVLQKAYDEEQKRQEDETKKLEEEQKKRAEARKKAAEERKKKQEQDAAEAKKKQEEADKVLLEAQLQTLSDRDREIKERELKLQQDLLTLKAAGVEDTKLVEENAQKDIQAIKDKYAEEDKKKREEDANKLKEDEKARFEDRLLGLDNLLAQETLSNDERRTLLDNYEKELLSQEELTENERTQIRQDFANQRKAIDESEIQTRQDLQTAYINLVGQFGSFISQIAGENKKLAIAGVVVEQASAIARIIQNTAIANAKSVAASPLTAGQPFVAINTISAGLSIASSIAAGVKAIQQIRSSDSGTAPSGGVNLPRASAGVRAPGVEGTTAPTILGTQGFNPQNQVAATIQNATQRPVRAYVVSQDISSNQALDRRTNTAATFG